MDNQDQNGARAIARLFSFDKGIEQKMYEVFVYFPKKKISKSVYVFDNDSGVTKIGVASDCVKRLATLSRGDGYKILNRFISKPTPDAFAIETKMHKHFSCVAIGGEYFRCSFQEAVAHLESLL